MHQQVPENPAPKNREDFGPLVIVTALLVTCYLTANIMAVKVLDVFGVALFDAGTLIFPFSYMLGDVLTELWGFRTARKVILLALCCNVLLMGVTALGVPLSYPEGLAETALAYNTVFSYMPRIVFASLAAFLVGELSNAYLMDRIRRLTGSRLLWVRTIGSSAAGHLLDTLIFCMIAFYGAISTHELFVMLGSLYLAKLAIEAAAGTPLAYAVIGALRKRYETTLRA